MKDPHSDEIVKLLYIADDTSKKLHAVMDRMNHIEISSGQHDISIQNIRHDIDGLGKKLRVHTDNFEAHNGLASRAVRATWHVVIAVIGVVLAAIGLLVNYMGKQ